MINIVSIDKINQRILNNLEKITSNNLSFCNHIQYCKENNIEFKHLNIDIRGKIHSLMGKGSYYASRLIDMCYSEDIKALQSFLNYNGKIENKAVFLDNIMSLLIKNDKKNIVEEFLINNYSILTKENTYQEIDLIKKLITLNNSTVFQKLLSVYQYSIDNSIKESFEFRDSEASKYTNNCGIDDLFRIIEFYLTEPNIKDISWRHDDPLRFSCEVIVNIFKTNTIDTTNKFKIMEQDITKNKKTDLFYFYKLKNDLQEIYFSHKSKPYSFNEVLDVLENYKYLFIA